MMLSCSAYLMSTVLWFASLFFSFSFWAEERRGVAAIWDETHGITVLSGFAYSKGMLCSFLLNNTSIPSIADPQGWVVASHPARNSDRGENWWLWAGALENAARHRLNLMAQGVWLHRQLHLKAKRDLYVVLRTVCTNSIHRHWFAWFQRGVAGAAAESHASCGGRVLLAPPNSLRKPTISGVIFCLILASHVNLLSATQARAASRPREACRTKALTI